MQISTPRRQLNGGLSQIISHGNKKSITVCSGWSPVPVSQARAAPWRSSVQLNQLRRWYSSDREADDFPGFLFQVPNPVTAIKNKFFTNAVRRKVDPSFSLEEFVIGAKQAVYILAELISSRNYDSMKEFLEPKAIENVKEVVASWTDEQQNFIQPDKIHIATPNIRDFFSHGQTHVLLIDVVSVGQKKHQDHSYLLVFSLRFSRTFGFDFASDWSISSVDSIKVIHFK
jgi:hypothetical protein